MITNVVLGLDTFLFSLVIMTAFVALIFLVCVIAVLPFAIYDRLKTGSWF